MLLFVNSSCQKRLKEVKSFLNFSEKKRIIRSCNFVEKYFVTIVITPGLTWNSSQISLCDVEFIDCWVHKTVVSKQTLFNKKFILKFSRRLGLVCHRFHKVPKFASFRGLQQNVVKSDEAPIDGDESGRLEKFDSICGPSIMLHPRIFIKIIRRYQIWVHHSRIRSLVSAVTNFRQTKVFLQFVDFTKNLTTFSRFNYRSTAYMVKHGFYDFLNWFDERAWYPLGRIVGGTVYPGTYLQKINAD